MPLVESTCCMNCHKLLQRIVVLETKLFAGLPKQTEHTADGHHGPPQHTAGESCESSESKQFIPSVEEQVETDRRTNRWHKQGARRKGSRDCQVMVLKDSEAECRRRRKLYSLPQNTK